ncbi:hypothetical protein [Foetidibacter luteolus]|uniref:hypothetical protein n=1 Tax=Foetidibacter luteolus TaxID=2608880 RepID=UPI00129AA425|nr:hypothetical protein [Foetidibacter luteolus]
MSSNDTGFSTNEKVTLTGTYARSNLSKSGQEDGSGYYKIVVSDSLEVILLPPYKEEAVRPKEEVQRFEGKKVTVTGIVMEHTPFSKPSLEEQPVTVDIPCFITIESIQLAGE